MPRSDMLYAGRWVFHINCKGLGRRGSIVDRHAILRRLLLLPLIPPLTTGRQPVLLLFILLFC